MKPKIIVISPGKYTFVDNDLVILAERFEVMPFIFEPKSGFKAIFIYLKLVLFLLKHIISVKYFYVWFADYHAFIAAVIGFLFRKKVFIVIGGYDAAKLIVRSAIPEGGVQVQLRYGVHTNRLRSFLVKVSCLLATKIFPVSATTQKYLFQHIGLDLSFKSEVIFNLVNNHFFVFDETITKENTVICIAKASNLRTMRVKGVDFFVEVAKSMPQFNFVLIGVSGEVERFISSQKIENLKVFSFLEKLTLIQYLQTSKVICQFSLYESFGVALAEGMLMGCVPITIQNLGAAEVIDQNCGILIEKQDLKLAQVAIVRAIHNSENWKNNNINRIKEKFSFELRKKQLLANFENLNSNIN